MEGTFFHIAFVVLFVSFIAIRVYYQRKVLRIVREDEYRESRAQRVRNLALGVVIIAVALVYIAWPALFSWASLPLPDWARWAGLAMSLASLPILWWVHGTLGSNFSSTLHVRAEHTLVTDGPYRWVRHPMYTTLFLYLLGNLLLTSNWLIGGLPLLGVSLIVITRLSSEEAAMIEKFGDRYSEYIKRTGRFLPPLRAH